MFYFSLVGKENTLSDVRDFLSATCATCLRIFFLSVVFPKALCPKIQAGITTD